MMSFLTAFTDFYATTYAAGAPVYPGFGPPEENLPLAFAQLIPYGGDSLDWKPGSIFSRRIQINHVADERAQGVALDAATAGHDGMHLLNETAITGFVLLLVQCLQEPMLMGFGPGRVAARYNIEVTARVV